MSTRPTVSDDLRELVAALDRRRAQPARPIESAVADASKTMRAAAVRRLARLEPRSVDGNPGDD